MYSLFGITNDITHTFREVHADSWELEDEQKWDNPDNFVADFKNSPVYLLNTKAKLYYPDDTPPSYSEVMTLFEVMRLPDYDPDNVVIVEPFLEDKTIYSIYFLLYSNYANSNIASLDEFRFKERLFTIIYQYAPIWLKKQEIQEKLRKLTEDEVIAGTKSIMNKAFHPQTIPSTATLEEIETIDEQSTMQHKKNKVEAYAALWEMVSTNVTQEFIDSFKPLFIVVTAYLKPLLF